ncbi:hypothetical protein NA57DRAFT_13818, partial [Rhizodiscina lignyota]
SRSSQYLDPEQAFRESLFDALADDEGAEYWEGVYGQPIHTYARPEIGGPTGELEQMTDEEYAAYVRAKMYEKTHQYIIEERERREEAKKRQKEERAKMDREREGMEKEKERWQAKIEESLRKGGERRNGQRWREAWEKYVHGWEVLKTFSLACDGGNDTVKAVRRAIPWPVMTGRWRDVSKDETEDFFSHAPGDVDLYTLLKTERVRWHPDKIQQRFGGTDIDADTMKSVTLVFQIIDRMWSDMRERR